MTKTFNDFGLPESLLANIAKLGYTTPTQIQSEAIPLILEGKDLLASSQTGSGKTAAFAIPIIAKILSYEREERRTIKALILAPTRELAIQTKECFSSLRGDGFYMNIGLIFGGADMKKQIESMKKGCDIVIATPGRLMDHLKRRTISEKSFHPDAIFVLDEFDRMLDMGFSKDVEEIARHLPVEKQTVMFSATTRDSIVKVAAKYLKKEYEKISVNSQKATHEHIVQDFRHVDHRDKYKQLTEELSKKEGSIIVFVNMKRIADELCESLKDDGHEAKAIHGDLRQKQREFAIKDFKANKVRILIATDVAARGLDIPNVALVVNFDVPNNLEDYTHRIGRTGRAGASGHAISFLTDKEKHMHRIFTERKDSDEVPPQPYRKGGSRGGFGGGRSGGGSFGGERRSFGDRPRSFGDRKPSFGASEGDDRRSGSFGGERAPRAFGEREFRPRQDGDAPRRSSFSSSGGTRAGNRGSGFGGGRSSFGDKKPRRY